MNRQHLLFKEMCTQEVDGSYTETCRKCTDLESSSPAEEAYPQNYMVGQPKNLSSEMHFDKFLTPSSFSGCFKTEVCSGSDSPLETMCWINEDEVASSVDGLKTSQSIRGHRFSNFEMLDVKIASSLKKINPNSNFKKRINPEEQKAQLDDRFFRGQIAFDLGIYPGSRHS